LSWDKVLAPISREHQAMEPRRILILQGHPDGDRRHLGHALAQAYREGAEAAGHQVRLIEAAKLEFPLLRDPSGWERGEPLPPGLEPARDALLWCEHLLIVFPLWLGDMPALLKGLLEQLARPGIAFHQDRGNPFAAKALGGRSARVVCTMGMPALVYRYFYRAHSLRSLERNILGFVGFAPVHETLIGGVAQLGEAGVQRWLKKLRLLGAAAS
jgi:putative NADPH-quinone reductase